MKKIFCALTVALLAFFADAESADAFTAHYAEYTLENGTELFVLEDFSSATVRIEYSVRAGISAQSKGNTGFFTLYSRLFKRSAQNGGILGTQSLSAECNADATRYVLTVAPAMTADALESLSKTAFAPSFSDAEIREELSALKTEVMQYAYTPAAFINGSIDSRVFSAAPWKHDSGIYPGLFSRTTPMQARKILSAISKNWYVPQNSAVFISGCIKKQAALALAERTFGQYQKAANPARSEAAEISGTKRKFVLHDSQFSADLTQLVIEYTALSMNQCDILSATLNNDGSTAKSALTQEKRLNIRGAEYINVAAAHKSGTSRLIVQTLMENNKVSPAEQTELFLQKLNEGTAATSENEYAFAKRGIAAGFSAVTSNSAQFMSCLAQNWGTEPLTNEPGARNGTLADTVLSHPADIFAEPTDSLSDLLQSAHPFVFVLLNTKNFTKHRKAFENAGYEIVSAKNSSWYMQQLQNGAKETVAEENDLEKNSLFDSKEALEAFITESRRTLMTHTLKNGIPVVLKHSQTTTNAAILISIAGGKKRDRGNSGFEELMAQSVAVNLQKSLQDLFLNNVLETLPEADVIPGTEQHCITLECKSEDVGACIRATGDALIFSDIAPTLADRAVYAAQTQKRLYNASPVNQLTFRAIKYLYDTGAVRDMFDAERDILQRTSYTDILNAYPRMLDASLYKIVVAGSFDDEAVLQALEETFALLTAQNRLTSPLAIPAPDFPTKPRRVTLKLRHQFFSDVKAEDAGPMPAVLVPTKDFSDPVQYWMRAPKNGTRERVIFDALLLTMRSLVGEAFETRLVIPGGDLDCVALTLLNVSHTAQADEAYKTVAETLLQSIQNEAGFCSDIKNTWILEALSESGTNRGTARLIADGTNAQSYLDSYQTILDASKSDFEEVCAAFIPAEAPLKLYSADAKK